jgi:lipopolysaccharide/colanic/teichoic acid biosynthesis glycosyltransferase
MTMATESRQAIGAQEGIRRAGDVVLAAVAVIVLAPVAAIVAMLIWLRLGSPVLFRQTRTGLRGTEFSILKFRTMRPPEWPGQPDGERETRLGRLLRCMSLDELPQVVNILRGEMSFIGPRPTLPEQVRHYSPHQRRRLDVRPGLTGWAQVCGRNSLSWPERIELDLWYIEHRNLWLDARIVARTLANLLRPRGVTGAGGMNPGFPAPDDPSGEDAHAQ